MKGKPSLHRSSRFGHKKGSHSLQTAWTHRMGAFYILFLGIKKWNVSGVLALSEARTCDSQSSFLFNIKIKKWNVSGVLALSGARTCDPQSSFLFNIKIKKWKLQGSNL